MPSITRAAIFLANDAGRFLILDNDLGVLKAETYTEKEYASRYANVAAFQAIVPTTYWRPNQWGDENKTLNDAAYGFQIRDKYWINPQGTLQDYGNSSPNTAGGAKSVNILDRTSVMYSYDNGAFLWIDPATRMLPPDQMTFAWVASPWQAARFDNLLEFQTIMEGTSLGSMNYGWGIQQFFFTKDPLSYTLSQPFSAAGVRPTSEIQRAFVLFNNDKSLYLAISNPDDPIPSMNLDWTRNPWEAARFTNLIQFQNIYEYHSGFFANLIKGWEIPQFYFTQEKKGAPVSDPYTIFYSSNLCSRAVKLPGEFANVYLWIVYMASQIDDWQSFYNYIWDWLSNVRNFRDYDCYKKWFYNQDHNLMQTWLYNIWAPNWGRETMQLEFEKALDIPGLEWARPDLGFGGGIGDPIYDYYTDNSDGQIPEWQNKYGNMTVGLEAHAGGFPDWGEFAYKYSTILADWKLFNGQEVYEKWFNNQDQSLIEQYLYNRWRIAWGK